MTPIPPGALPETALSERGAEQPPREGRPVQAAPAQGPADEDSFSPRLDLLARTAQLCEGRVEPGVLDDVRAVAERAGERARLSPRHTVVALAGATGSGKSTLFNALAGLELSDVGVKRPTTSTAMACIWGEEPADAVLDWLDVPPRRRVVRDSALDARHDPDLDGLVLLDLPDHDSRQVAHRQEVDRLVRMVDLLVWVLDPQKYADAALHDRYLRAMTLRQSCMVAVLNQVDTLDEEGARECVADLGRLLASEGLSEVAVRGISARAGTGLSDLRALLVERVAQRRGLAGRLQADLDMAVDRLAGAVDSTGTRPDPGGGDEVERDLVAALSSASGVAALVESLEAEQLAVGLAATGWPPTRWVDRTRRDPLEAIRAREEERARAGRGATDALASLESPTDTHSPALVPAGPAAGDTRVPQPSAAAEAESAAAARGTVETAAAAVGAAEDGAPGDTSTSVAERRPPVDETRVDESVRAVVEAATAHMPATWRQLVRARVRTAARGLAPALTQALDENLARVMPTSSRYPRYLWPVQGLQWALLAAVTAGVAWSGYLVGSGIGGGAAASPVLVGVPVPVLLLAVGVVGGYVVTALAPRLVRRSARVRRRRVEEATASAVEQVARRTVLEPLRHEVQRHADAVDGLRQLRSR